MSARERRTAEQDDKDPTDSDGDGVPDEPPACARDIVADLLAGSKLGRALGTKFAAEWGVAVDELEVFE
jgi:hypothetical protein